MNYSEQATYGRKIVKGTYKKKSEFYKRLYISWGVCFLIGLVIGIILFWGISSLFKDEPAELIESNTTPESIVETGSIATLEPKITSLGEYKLTAYCSCEKCCGKTDGITASGVKAVEGVTIAADTKIHPFGTKLCIDGHEYTVQDRGGVVKGNHIDIYFDNHQEALEFGVQYKEIFLKEGEMLD